MLFEQAIKKMEILRDNEISLILTKKPMSQNCTKYIDMMHHYIRKLVEEGKLGIE